MAPPSDDLAARLQSLLALFNRNSLDLPEGVLSRDAVFRLNGVAYEDTLGRSAADPLVRLIARGAGGYRFLVKTIRYAMPDATVSLEAPELAPETSGRVLRADGWLRGRLRGGGGFDEPFATRVAFSPSAAILEIDVVLTPAAVSRIAAARQEQAE
jgi:hypothetical protein